MARGRLLIWMTCVTDGLEHAVADELAHAGLGTGRYPGMCGHLVTPGSLATPHGACCQRCRSALAAPPALAGPTATRAPDRWWRSLLDRRTP
jgi:hypothetical protein